MEWTCWICKRTYGTESLTGRCDSCRPIIGLEAVAMDGGDVVPDVGGYLPDDEFESHNFLHGIYARKRFADDMGYYHQFKKQAR